jgi:23S rRNA G2445 N2-methylase RlmL
VRIGAEHGEETLLALYSDMGRAFARFRGWRAACFVANPNFLGAFAHAPIMTKPASNADLRGAFLVFQL